MTVIDPEESPKYPWGRLAHKILISSVKEAEVANGSYIINGFIHVLNVWVFWALPVYAKVYGEPFPDKPDPPLLAYRGSRGRKNVQANLHCQTIVRHFVRKEFDEMFPVWDNDKEDVKIMNIVRAMYGHFGPNWRWNESHWPADGVLVANTRKGKDADIDEEDDEGEEVEPVVKGGKRKAKAGLSGREKRVRTEGDGGDESLMDVFKLSLVDFGIKMDSLMFTMGQVNGKVDSLNDKVVALTVDLASVKKMVAGDGIDEEMYDKEKKEQAVKKSQGKMDEEEEEKNKVDEEKKQEEEEEKKQEEKEAEKQEEEGVAEKKKQEAEEEVDKKKSEEEVESQDKGAKGEQNEVSAANQLSTKKNVNADKGNIDVVPKRSTRIRSKIGYIHFHMQSSQDLSIAEISKQETGIDFNRARIVKNNAKEQAAQTMARARNDEAKRQLALKPVGENKPVQASAGHGYDPCLPIDKHVLGQLNKYIKSLPGYPAKPAGSSVHWYWLLRTNGQWLQDLHMDGAMDLLRLKYHNNPSWFRSSRICFLDCLLQSLWVSKYQEWKTVGFVPAGAYDYHNGVLPVFCQSNKIWGIDIDDIYSPLHVKGDHWVAIWISIPDRHVTIWDCNLPHSSEDEIAQSVTPICEILPHVMQKVLPKEESWKHPDTPFTFHRVRVGVPHNKRSGDCGVYCVKFIEFHSLGMEFPEYLCDKNIKQMRDKLAGDICTILRRNGQEKRTGKELELLDMYEGATV